MLCERCGQWSAFYELYGEKLCDFCLIARKTEYLDQDYGHHISLPIKKIPCVTEAIKIRSRLKQTKLNRVLIDMSPVKGSDVYAYVVDHEVTPEFFEQKVKPILKAGHFSDPTFILCRPVFEEERAVNEVGRVFSLSSTKESDMTDTLDVFFSFLTRLNYEKDLCEITGRKYSFSEFVSKLIGAQFYDCMHSGMNKKLVSLLKTLIRRLGADLSTEVYPADTKGDNWYTLGDWLMEVHDLPEVNLKAMPENVVSALTK